MKAIVLMFFAATLYAQQFTVVEASIVSMRSAMEQKRVTSRELVNQYLIRIALYDHRLHAAIMINTAMADPTG